MKALVLGSGGREHALAWKISESIGLQNVFLHPGNFGTLKLGFKNFGNVNNEPSILTEIAKEKGVELVVIGPEAYLEAGYGDVFRSKGFLVVGPNKRGAMFETSKVFAKKFMSRANIPTADYIVVEMPDELLSQNFNYPVVLKLDCLAQGKGVLVAKNESDVRDYAKKIKNKFGNQKIVVEKFIAGREASYMCLTDGKNFIPLPTSTDYKRAFDHDKGDNTGGMGAISPSPFLNSVVERKIHEKVLLPFLKQLEIERLDFSGVLYVGLIIDSDGEPYVLEFNVRFGDPETQAVVPLLKDDFFDVLVSLAKGKLRGHNLNKKDFTSLYVVLASQNYPEKPVTGDVISGVDTLSKDVYVFFSSVDSKNGELVTSGGRVMGVGAVAECVESTRKLVYENIEKIHFRGMHYRKDIGL